VIVHELSLSWRSRVRIALGVMATFAVGVVAATAGAPWYLRGVAVIAFLVGVYAVLDAVVFTASWRFTASALKVPTLLSRRREIAGREDLTVELRDGVWSRLGVSGPNGTRLERINPLISGTDLRRWWDAVPDD
jgi:hypothetical protein